MKSKSTFALIATAACALSTQTSAHLVSSFGAHTETSFLDGLLHPLTGLDHLAAILAVGLWSALSERRLWTTPLAFAAMLLAGALLGSVGGVLPAVEPMIAASLLVLGLLVALRVRAPTLLAAALVGAFAVFHGMAHGTGLSGSSAVRAPLAAMLMTTVALHSAGLGLGLLLRTRSQWWTRLAGTAVTLFGGFLLLQIV